MALHESVAKVIRSYERGLIDDQQVVFATALALERLNPGVSDQQKFLDRAQLIVNGESEDHIINEVRV